MADDKSLPELCSALEPVLGADGARLLLTQIGVPPDLRYLVDGLRRTQSALARFPDELDLCLSAVPAAHLDGHALRDGIAEVIRWVERQSWSPDDPRRRPMQRPDANSRNPLAGDYLSVTHHWGNLFYALQPDLAGVSRAEEDDAFDSLMAEFSVYVIAAQSSVDPGTWLRFCEFWCSERLLPLFPIYKDTALHNRVAEASRAVRRLSRREHRVLLKNLVATWHGDALHERLFKVLLHPRPELEPQFLQGIARLLESVRPGWQRPGAPLGHADQRVSRGRFSSSHRTLSDGYVRIQEPLEMPSVTEADDGTRIEHFQEPAADQSARLADGTMWIPRSEQRSDGDIDIVDLWPQPDSGDEKTVPTVRAAAAHLRRYELALGITKDRMSQREAHQLLEALARADVPKTGKEALLALHAVVALGRPIDQVADLEVHEAEIGGEIAPTNIHFSLTSQRWTIPAPAPAWGDRSPTPIERSQSDQLLLGDRTGFFKLLRRFGLAKPGRPFQELTWIRQDVIDAFLRKTLPRSDATLARCSQFLFYRLLRVTTGDFGLAGLITGHVHSHGGSVRHYANYSALQVARAYGRAWRYTAEVPTDELDLSPNEDNLGARRVPCIRTVRLLFEWLAAHVRDGAIGMNVRRNCYTAYTLCGMVLGLGVRPVTDLLLTGSGGIRADQLFASFADKVKSDYDRRINPIPESLAQHLDAYGSYRRAVSIQRWASGREARFLYLAPGCTSAEPFRPKDFEEIAGGIFPLEMYALRRFARTELAAMPNVTGEDIDAYMGHWFFGASPFDPLSTYPVRRLTEFADAPLTALLKSVGFTPLESPR